MASAPAANHATRIAIQLNHVLVSHMKTDWFVWFHTLKILNRFKMFPCWIPYSFSLRCGRVGKVYLVVFSYLFNVLKAIPCVTSYGMWVAWCQSGGYSSAICVVRCLWDALGCGPEAMGEPLGEEQMPLWLLTILLCVNTKQKPNPSAEGIEVNKRGRN